MMNIRLTVGAEFSAALTPPIVASEDDSPHFAPLLVMRVGP